MSESTVTDTPQMPPNFEYTLEELIPYHGRDLWTLDAARLNRTSPYTVAQLVNRLDVDESRTILRKLSEERAGEVLAEVDSEHASEIVSEMREGRAVRILDSLDPDDAADVFGELEDLDRERLLKGLTTEAPESAKQLVELMSYPHDSAGGVMTTAVTSVTNEMTTQHVIEHIRAIRDKVENVFYIYVTDRDQKLLGVLSMRDLVLENPNRKVGEYMRETLRGVCFPEEDREVVALRMAEFNLHALPVVDHDYKLLGLVSHDDVIDIINREATEDLQKMAGAGGDESVHDSVLYSFGKRSPWLFVNLLTASMAAAVVYLFEGKIEQLSLLAVFMPLVASLGGNAGSQTLAVTIRSLALGDIGQGEGRKICLLEALKGLALSVVVGVVSGLAVALVTGNWLIGVTMLLAMVLTMSVAGAAGALIPLLLKHFRLDPAQSSSIFLTAATDIIGFGFFLALGSLLLLS